MIAIQMEDLRKIEDLIKNKGVDVNVDVHMGDTPLVYAIEQDKYEAFKKLLELGADVNKPVPKQGIGDAPKDLTPLMVALTSEDDRFLNDLLQKGADVNAQNTEGLSALMLAYEIETDKQIQFEDVIERLVQAGANLELDDVNGETVLSYAVRRAANYDGIHWLELLFAGPTPPNVNHRSESGSTPLHDAVRVNYPEGVDFLLEKGADPNIANNEGFPPLFIAVAEDVSDDPTDMVKSLLSKGAKTEFVQTNTNYTWSILTTAMNQNKAEAAYELLDVPDINVNIPDPSDNGSENTPLMLAISEDYVVEFVQRLLDKGANVNARNAYEETALTMAVSDAKMDINIVRLLLDKGADIITQDENGWTPLILATMNSHVEVVKLLLERGANKEIKDKVGKTALDHATETGNDELIELLGGEVASGEMWNGFTASDAQFFDAIVENEDAMNKKSICPFCLQYIEWGEVVKTACKYLAHKCDPSLRHERLYNLYKNKDGDVKWCAVCGRHCYGHGHFPLTDTKETVRPNLLPYKPGADSYKASSCPLEGGGGPDEKIRRVDGLLRYICEVQDEAGKRPAKKVRDELIEEAWKAASSRIPKTVQDIKTGLKFKSYCDLPTSLAGSEEVSRDIPNINPEPIKHENAECVIEMDVHDDGRPVYEFRHVQPGAKPGDEPFSHNGQYICGPDLEGVLKNAGGQEDKCPIDPENCKGKLHPDEVKFVLGEESEAYKDYRRRFNEKNKVGGKRRKQSRRRTYRNKKFRGGVDAPPIMSKMEDVQCAMPEKKTAGRRTFRNKMRATRKRRYTRR